MDRQQKNPLGYLFFALALLCAGLGALGAYEGVALAFGLFPPITWEVARAEGQHFYPIAGVACLICFGFGALVGHFFWAQSIPPWFRMRRRG